MDAPNTSSPTENIERIRQAIDHHDLDELTACFAADYQSTFPAHPDLAFQGHEQMQRNWAQIFRAVPDIHATLLRTATDGATIWAEWEWVGTLAWGEPFLQRGVTISGIEHGKVVWVRLYMEPVREGAPGLEQLERGGKP